MTIIEAAHCELLPAFFAGISFDLLPLLYEWSESCHMREVHTSVKCADDDRCFEFPKHKYFWKKIIIWK